MNIWLKALVAVVMAAVLFGVGYKRGWFAGDQHARAELQPKIAALEYEKAEAERQAVAVRDAGRVKADKLATDLLAANARITKLQRTLNDEIRARTSAVDRAVGAAAVRLLNELSPITGPRTTGPSGAAAAEPLGHVGSAAATADPDRRAAESPQADDGSGASEQAVALALSERGTLYLRCRERVMALASYVTAITQ